MERVICLIIGYAFGMIQTSYILGRIKGIDIRSKGSGNAGTTNAMRVLGKKAGFATVFVDIIKCIAAVLVTSAIFKGSDMGALLRIYTGAGVVLGHDFPFYLKFHGGKGIAATAGLIISFMDWRLILIGVICFFIPFFATHYVSLSSLMLSASFIIGIIIFGQLGSYEMDGARLIEMYIVVAFLTALAYIQHRANIGRLIHGNERRWGAKYKKQQ